MTTPRFARTNHGKGHSYTLDGRRVPGVTTVLGILDKPALVDWAARVTAAHAMNHWQQLSDMDPLDRYERLKGARWEVTREATIAGTRIHDLGEKLAHGLEVEVPEQIRPQVEAYAQFLDDWELEVIATEQPVCNTGYRYAGTFDMVARSGRLDGMTLMLDIKTGKRAYPEAALQLAAYRLCDLRLESVPQEPGPRGGKRRPLVVEQPMIPTDGAAVIHVIGEQEESQARVDLLPVDTSPDVQRVFLHVLEVYHSWSLRLDSKSDVFAPPIGEPIFPEGDNPFYTDEGDE